jgi:hypothetical protein
MDCKMWSDVDKKNSVKGNGDPWNQPNKIEDPNFFHCIFMKMWQIAALLDLILIYFPPSMILRILYKQKSHFFTKSHNIFTLNQRYHEKITLFRLGSLHTIIYLFPSFIFPSKLFKYVFPILRVFCVILIAAINLKFHFFHLALICSSKSPAFLLIFSKGMNGVFSL